tara:strand:- start:450 stop:806 length:357 start_codon:yes stop_codon:yes gene_type:complete
MYKEIVKLLEAAYKLDRKLTKCIMTLKLERETHVPDLMTRIRILPGIAVVAQKDKVARFFDGDAQLQISIKFMGNSDNIMENIEVCAKSIKELPGVKVVAIDMYDKREITYQGKKLVF